MFTVLGIPAVWLSIISFGYGVIIGSFLNVLIYRFHTGKSLSGHSHCLSCGTRLKWYELFPLLSYLGLRGHCRTCNCYIPIRYFLVEISTALLFVASYAISMSLVELLYLWAVMALLIVIAVYDINHFIIPDAFTITLTGVIAAWFGLRAWMGEPLLALGLDVLAAGLGASFLLLLWVVSRGKWIGFGDVKLAVPLGLLVGAPLVFSMVVFSFWIGAVISLLLIGLAHLQGGKLRLRFPFRTLTIKSAVPFAPFLIAGSLVTLFTHLNVLDIFTF